MSEDSEILENHPFHPTDPPHGFRNFDLGALSKDQQRMLNKMKSKKRIENEMYLKAHPEVRGIISIIYRHVLSRKPEQDIHEIVGSFFNRPRTDLVRDLLEYFDDIGYNHSVVDKLRKEVPASTASYTDSSSTFESSIFTTSLSSLESSMYHQSDI